MHEPESCCIIAGSEEGLIRVLRGVKKYKKQYRIDSAIKYCDEKLVSVLEKSHAVFISDVPIVDRTEIINY